GYGELVLTNQNTYGYAGPVGQNTNQTFINQGWITVENSQALGNVPSNFNPVDQPGVQVAAGAALVLKQDLAGSNLNLTYPMTLSGMGILHRFPWLNQMGALVNLDGSNTISGDLYLSSATGIGVEIDGANQPYPNFSQLVVSGTIHDGASA